MRLIDADLFEKQLNRYVEYNDDGEQEINADKVFITLHEQPTITVEQGSDLISRQGAIEYFKSLPYITGLFTDEEVIYGLQQVPTVELPIKDKCAFCPHCTNCDVNDDLTIKPTTTERKRGEWIPNYTFSQKCNLCGFSIHDWDWHRFNYCPNCGAYMRGGGESDQ